MNKSYLNGKISLRHIQGIPLPKPAKKARHRKLMSAKLLSPASLIADLSNELTPGGSVAIAL